MEKKGKCRNNAHETGHRLRADPSPPGSQDGINAMRLIHKRSRPSLLHFDGSSVTLNSYGFYSATVIICALAHLYIEGPADKKPQLPLELSLRGFNLRNITLATCCLAAQTILCFPAYCVEVAHKSALKHNRELHIPRLILILLHSTAVITSYSLAYWTGTKVPPILFRGMLALLGVAQQIKTCTFSYVNSNLRREYIKNRADAEAHGGVKLNAKKVLDSAVDDQDSSNNADSLVDEWTHPYCKLSELSPDMRLEINRKKYPSNVNLRDYLYFLVVPTLCYQVAYPRSTSTSIKDLLFYTACMVACYLLCIPVLETIAISVINLSCISDLSINRAGYIDYAVIGSLSIVFVFVFFFGFLHAGYNFVAELTKFGDRHFYGRWWNSGSVSEYWRLWNLPVVNFNKSVLVPYLRYYLHLNKDIAVFAIFFLSGIAHELLFAPVTRCVRMVFFGLFIAQVPLVLIVSTLEKWKILAKARTLPGKILLNMCFWIQYIFCAITFFAYLSSGCWLKSTKCLGNTPVIPQNTRIISLMVGYDS